MTLVELVRRWLVQRGAWTELAPRGVRVHLAEGDSLTEALGSRFTLMPTTVEATVPAEVEPVYPGSRVTDLLVGDLEDVRGIAVARADDAWRLAGPLFIFSFVAVFTTDGRVERFIRFGLTEGGAPFPLSPDMGETESAGEAEAWQERVQMLAEAASATARTEAERRAMPIEREAQLRLYRVVRRLAAYYAPRLAGTGGEESREEYRRRLADETERHRLRITLTLLGVTVVVP